MSEKPRRPDARTQAAQALLESYLDLPRRAANIPRRGHGEPIPLSYGQQLLWLHSQLAPDLPLYNEPVTIHRKGPLDVAALEGSLNEILRRHEAWRTSFPSVDGRPLQLIHEAAAIRLPVVDLRGLPEAEREKAALRLAVEDARRPFDLAEGPLLRALLIRLGDEEHRLFLVLHHIIFDGVSIYSVFLPELVALYEAYSSGGPSPLSELPIQYADYALWQREHLTEEALQAQLAYWRRQLASVPTLALPTDRPRPAVQTFRGAMHPLALPRGLTEALRALSKREGVTLFVTLLAAFKTLLHRYTGEEDLVIGTVTAGRTRSEVHSLLGFFLNPLLLRTDLSGTPTFRTVLGRVRETTLNALSHPDVPFELLVKHLRPKRDPSRNPLYQVLFSLEPPMPSLPAGWNLTQIDVETGAAKLDLYLELDDRPEGLVGRFMYNTDLFDAASLARMAGHWETLLAGIVESPGEAVSRLPLLTPNERTSSPSGNRVQPRKGFVGFGSEETIPNRFEAVAAAHPSCVAVRTARSEWTYEELNRRANRIARVIHGTPGPEAVALFFEHDAPLIAGVLGALKAGKSYVPLDPSYPRERIGDMLRDSQARLILANHATTPLARILAGSDFPIVDIDSIAPEVSGENLRLPLRPESLAYILYTSGSTGRPKGVAQSHRNVLAFIKSYTSELQIDASDRLTLVSSCSFDASVVDIFGALLNGARLDSIDVPSGGTTALIGALAKGGVTIFHSTPTLYRNLVGAAGSQVFPTIRLVVLGGEEVHKSDVDSFKKHFPEALFVNLAGQTESSINLLYFVDKHTPLSRASVPMGYPVADTEILLLDGEGGPTELLGEIGIRSAHLALGYFRQEELTRRAFLPDPEGGMRRIYRTGDLGRRLPDGSLEFVGRRDDQVKVRGFRIEPSEVEDALIRNGAIRSAAVMARGNPPGERDLVAYIVCRPGPAPTVTELRSDLRTRLPAYLIPSSFVVLDALPLTPSGKVDRRALTSVAALPVDSSENYVAPRTRMEILVARVWQEALGHERIGLHDNFFDLGGHSLLSMEVITRMENVIGQRINPREMILQTLEQVAAMCQERSEERALAAPGPGPGRLLRRVTGWARRSLFSDR
jgi:amino acid adenylation domain-containing protein